MEKQLAEIQQALKVLTNDIEFIIKNITAIKTIQNAQKDQMEYMKKVDENISLVLKRIAFEEDESSMIYFKNKTLYDFSDISTKKAYESYVDFFNTINDDVMQQPMSQNKFNSMVRKLFPSLIIAHTTKNGKQFYYFKNNL